MNDPASAQKPKGWPLFAIAVLVALLAGFLFLRWRKKEDVPAVVKEAVPISRPVESENGVKLPVPPPAKPAPPPAEGDFRVKIAELKKAIEAKNWDEAATALDAARKLQPTDPDYAGFESAIAEGRKKSEAESLEAAKAAELKKAQNLEWASVREKV